MTLPHDCNHFEALMHEPLFGHWIARTQVILNSHRDLLGRELIDRSGNPADEARRLFALPAIVLAHGTEADAILNYGNRAALELWEMTPEALIKLPSRLTAEPGVRAAREKALEDTKRQGFSTGYEGIRISATGRRFTIHDATIWNLVARDGRPAGQAATFERWSAVS
jgi:MEKHLA domain